MERFDVIVIGFGNGGKFLAGSLAAQGQRVAFVEKSDMMYGGTCPNVGCVPTKFLVNRAEMVRIKGFTSFEEKAAFYGQSIRDKKELRKRILSKLFNIFGGNPNITLYTGTAKFVSPKEIEVSGKDFTAAITATAALDVGENHRDLRDISITEKLLFEGNSGA